MLSPGQDLQELISRLSVDHIEKLLGEDIVATVAALDPPNGISAALRKIMHEFFHCRPDDLLGSSWIREICYDAMTIRKLDELASRISLNDRRCLHNFDPLTDTATRQRYLGFFGIDTHTVALSQFELAIQDAEPSFGLFAHQRRAVARVWSALEGGFGRVVLHMPTGAGKTRTAMHVASRFLSHFEPAIIVWLAASSELLDQAAEAFQLAWAKLGNRTVSLMRYWGSHNSDFAALHDGIVIAGLQKMHSLDTRSPLHLLRLGARTKLVVVDEAHQAIAPTYQSVITNLAETGVHNALLGLTATPGRTWSDIAADEKLSAFFGERKVMLEVDGWDDPVSYLIAEGYLAKPTFRQLHYESPTGLDKSLCVRAHGYDDYGDSVLEALSMNVHRNISVVAELNRLVESGHRRILLFTASIRHAEVVAAVMSALKIDARVVTSETPATMRRRTIKAFRTPSDKPIILCNFGVLTTGFDAPNCSAVVIARPTRSLVLYSQMVGRATRGPKAGGNETCEISTVVDTELPGFGDITEAFTNWEDVWR